MELFNSVGIELEIENISQNNLGNLPREFRVHRDASCESDAYFSNGIEINTKDSTESLINLLRLSKSVSGCELVTAGTLDTSNLEYLYVLKNLTNMLISSGETPKSYRAGFHVHINLSYNLRILKSILRLARHLEQVLYLLGGMGYDYRGFKNDSTYCRPMTKFGPVCVPVGRGGYSQAFSISELLKCKTTEEFKYKYGDIKHLSGSHYIPIRYHGINLLPLFTQGSLEFRMFNKSLNPYFLMAIIEFCKSFSEYAVLSSFDSLKEENLLKENSIFDLKGEDDKQKIIETFDHFLELSSLKDEQIIDILYEILHTSFVESIILPKKYIFSHLIFHRQGNRCPTHWQGSRYVANEISENKIQQPKFEDIHVLREDSVDLSRRERGLNLMEDITTLTRPSLRRNTISATRMRELIEFINIRYGAILSPLLRRGDDRYFRVRGNQEYNNRLLVLYISSEGRIERVEEDGVDFYEEQVEEELFEEEDGSTFSEIFTRTRNSDTNSTTSI